MSSGRGRSKWIVGGIAFAALAVATWQFVVVASQGSERVRELFEAMGVWAPVLYVVTFALFEPFGALGIFFVGPGSLIWSWPELFLLSWLGAIGAALVGFSFARWLGREWVASRVPARLLAYEARLERRPLLGVALLRLTLFLWPPVHWMLGLSRVRLAPYLLGSAIGFVVPMAVFTWLGKSIVDELLAQPPGVLIAAGVVIILLIGISRWLMSRGSSPPAEPGEDPVASTPPSSSEG
jgi:uncharacterized membrane protein YdjX (TVP38/TMEM64 family)